MTLKLLKSRFFKFYSVPQRIVQCSTFHTSKKKSKSLTLENMNPNVRRMEYAVRGPIVARAAELEQRLAKGEQLPFTEVTRANIGDCHACGQPPISFIRQVAALCVHPALLDSSLYPADAKDRARRVLAGCKGGSVGSYSDSPGVTVIRDDVAQYISDRDGIKCDPNEVFLCTGASDGIKSILRLLVSGEGRERSGVMIPIPQYPLYSAALAEFNCHQIGYYLNEADGWSLDVSELRRALNEAKAHCTPRALCVINPGNPTGQVLSKENLQEIVRFAHQEGLFLLADEVYQHNVYAPGSRFCSLREALLSQDSQISEDLELASFMSVSKGYMGECGMRGGFCQVMNLDPQVYAQLQKAISVNLCPPVTGQAVMECVVNPPRPGEQSHEQFEAEKNKVLSDLKLKAGLVSELFNSIPGISCNQVMGAMYAFPQLHLPPAAVRAAEERGIAPDVLYCFELLERAGICVVPGSGFGQVKGTAHFRTTILPQVDDLRRMLQRFEAFHTDFMRRFS